VGSALPIKTENPFFYIMEVNFNSALRSHDLWGSSLAKTEYTICIINIYVRNVRNLRLATGGGWRGDWEGCVRSHAIPHRSSVGMPVCGRLKRLWEEANACIPSLSARIGRGCRGQIDARLRQVSYECASPDCRYLF